MSLLHSASSQGIVYTLPETISPIGKWGTFVDVTLPGKSLRPLRDVAVVTGGCAFVGWVALFNGMVVGLLGPMLTLFAAAMAFFYMKWRGRPRMGLRATGLTLNVWNKTIDIQYDDVDLLWYRYDSIRIDLKDKRYYIIPQRLMTQAERIELVYTLRIALDGRFMGYF